MDKFERQIEEILERKRRADRIFVMRKAGMTMEEIASHFGLTRERVRQILAEIKRADEKIGVKDA